MAKKSIVIVGFGGIARSWLRHIKQHDDFTLTGIVDVDTELLENIPRLGTGLDDDQGYMSIEDACTYGEKPDLVIICTPIPTHAALAKEAMEQGINVICEKNMASSVPQARQMVQAAIDHPELCTAAGTQYRYSMHNWTARQFFQTGAFQDMIGKLGMVLWEDWGFRGERRWGWRRFLEEVYLEDMSVHWFDTMRYITGMEVVQVKADTFMPRYSSWHGSSTVFASLALAKPEHFNDRHEWIWVQFAGDWQRGPISNDRSTRQEFYGKDGFAKLSNFGVEVNRYKSWDKATDEFEEDAYLAMDAGPMEGMKGVNHTGQGMILEMMSRGIDSRGKIQPGTNFKEAFKSFTVSAACKESSFTGQAVHVPKYWQGWLD